MVVLMCKGGIVRGVVGKQGRGCLLSLALDNCAKYFLGDVCGEGLVLDLSFLWGCMGLYFWLVMVFGMKWRFR